MKKKIKNWKETASFFGENSLVFILLAGVCVTTFIGTLDNGFVADDRTLLTTEEMGNVWRGVKSLSAFSVYKNFLYSLTGTNPLGYRISNLTLHLLNTFLATFFVLSVTERRKLALLSGFLFALHPVHVEAVAWVSADAYLLYTFFFFISFLFFHFYLEEGKNIHLFGCLFFYALSLTSKPWALPLFPLFFIYEVLVKKRKPSWHFYLALFFLLAGYGLKIAGQAEERVVSLSGGGEGVSSWQNPLLIIPYSLTRYAELFIWPKNLSLYHEGRAVARSFILLSRVFTFLLFLSVLIFRKKRIFLFFLALFLFSVSISFSPLQISWFYAERYTYLGVIGFCVLLAWFFLEIEERFEAKHLSLFLLVPLLSFYFIRDIRRERDWQNRGTLWRATVRVAPGSPRAHNNMGDVYVKEGKLDKAVESFQEARRLRPGYADATHNLANTYLQKGDLEKAEEYFKEAVKENPELYQSYFLLSYIKIQNEEFQQAKAYLERTLELNPEHEDARQLLRQIEEAINKASPGMNSPGL